MEDAEQILEEIFELGPLVEVCLRHCACLWMKTVMEQSQHVFIRYLKTGWGVFESSRHVWNRRRVTSPRILWAMFATQTFVVQIFCSSSHSR